MYTFELGALGRSFATRGRGAELRERLLADATNPGVEVNFTGVTHVSSFLPTSSLAAGHGPPGRST